MAFAPVVGWAMTALSAYGAIMGGKAEAAQAQAQANAYTQQAQLDEANAKVRLQQADAQEEAVRRETRRRLGQLRGEIIQSGTGLGGSNAAIYQQSARDAELDALNVRYGGLMEARGLMNQASANRYNAAAAKAQGKAAKRAGYMRAGTSILTGMAGGSSDPSRPGLFDRWGGI